MVRGHQTVVTSLNLGYGGQRSLNKDSVSPSKSLNDNLEAGLVVVPAALLGDDDDVPPDLLGVVTEQLDDLRLVLQILQLLENFQISDF